MKRRNLAPILLCLCLGAAAFPQNRDESPNQPPELLRQAAHCLVTDGPDAKKLQKRSKELTLGYYLDTRSYPGEQALYVVDFSGPNLSKGLVFVFFVRQRSDQRVLRVENNASFIRKKKGIEFTERPVGGVWTEEHVQDAVDRILQTAMYLFQVKEIRGPYPEVRCESYSDVR